MNIKLNAEMIEAIKELQRTSEYFSDLVEDACDYIIEWTDESVPCGDAASAIGIIRWLRDFDKIISKFKLEDE